MSRRNDCVTGVSIGAVFGGLITGFIFAAGEFNNAVILNPVTNTIKQAAESCTPDVLKSCANTTIGACTAIIKICGEANLTQAASALATAVDQDGRWMQIGLLISGAALFVGAVSVCANRNRNEIGEERPLQPHA